ncbi:MAG: hypothetical protein M0R49_01065 [Limnochordia bacterium]|nr:hypothetical protein [Limnochordia bacterium]
MASAPVDRLTSKRVVWLATHYCVHRHSYLEHFKCFRRDFPKWQMPKRAVILADLHCGHKAGLTPLAYQSTPDDSASGKVKCEASLRKALWRLYADKMQELKPIDVCLVNGDVIDGKGDKSGGTEQIEMDRHNQAEMGALAIGVAEADQYVITNGTGYHTGTDEDFEKLLSQYLDNVTVKGHAFIDVNGCIIDAKHKVGSSQVPYGRASAVLKEKVWADIWNDVGVNPKSNIIVRSHVHYYEKIKNSQCTAIVTPALQGLGTKYGTRQCSGLVDWGFLWADIEGPDDYEIKEFIPKEANGLQKVEVIKV